MFKTTRTDIKVRFYKWFLCQKSPCPAKHLTEVVFLAYYPNMRVTTTSNRHMHMTYALLMAICTPAASFRLQDMDRCVGQLSLASLRVTKSSTGFGWGKGRNVTSASWQVTLCDPIWHVSSCSSVTGLHCELLYPYTLLQTHNCKRTFRSSQYESKTLTASLQYHSPRNVGAVTKKQQTNRSYFTHTWSSGQQMMLLNMV